MDDKNKIAPKLSVIKKEEHFNVPQDYFDKFPVRLGNKIHGKESTGLKKGLVLTLRPYLAAAAMFTGLVIVGVIIYNILNSGGTDNEPGRTEIAAVIENDIYNYSEDMIFEAVCLVEGKTEAEGAGSYEEDITDGVIDYLIDENINVYDIIDAL